ncbi:isochorismate synthase [Rhizobium sp. PP-CC-2G-626]|nr:isochorismate synthase [Rhizobium sp. PP-CC-2G-626]
MATSLARLDRNTPPQSANAKKPFYILKTSGETFFSLGQNAVLEEGPLSTLSDRTARFFRQHQDGPDILVGALPFDSARSAFLFQPTRVMRVQGKHNLGHVPGFGASRSTGEPNRILSVSADPAPDVFGKSVLAGLEAMAASQGGLQKIVLSRSLKVFASRDFSIADLMSKLALDESITVFATPLRRQETGGAMLVGATPELLVEKRGNHIASHPLAGSAKRYADDVDDRRSADSLWASDKDRREHAMVVESIMDLLTPYCFELSAPEGMALRATASMWHLGTKIVGRLKDASASSEHFVSLLHPTPAVCGVPRAAAHSKIGELETYDRDFYAGAVGWCDSAGDGRWFVSIRCAEVEGAKARLYAGAGVVPGSTPQGEIAETAAKFRAMLDAFGIDRDRSGI